MEKVQAFQVVCVMGSPDATTVTLPPLEWEFAGYVTMCIQSLPYFQHCHPRRHVKAASITP